MKQQLNRIATMKNNIINRFIIRRLRKALNTETYRLRIRALHSNRKKVLKEKHKRYSENVIRIKDAQRFNLYLDDKRIEQARERRRQQYAVEQALKRFK